jgi:hypothetical protein
MPFFYVYILQSESSPDHYYVGFTENLARRLDEHTGREFQLLSEQWPPGPLDRARWLTTMSVMQVTVREFTRKFPSYRRAALAGKEVRVRDRAGNGFVFRSVAEKPVSLAHAMGDLIGSVQTGQRKKSLGGYGRD